MNSRWTRLAALVALALPFVALSPVHAQEASGGAEAAKSWWNPFGIGVGGFQSDADDVVESSFFDGGSADDGPLFKLPTWPWASEDRTKDAKSSPMKTDVLGKASAKMSDTVSKVTVSTKRFWGKTVDVLTPFDKPAAKPRTQGYQPQYDRQEPKKQSFWNTGWWTSDDDLEDTRPRTVAEFIGSKRPRF